ncbi:MAG: TIGR04255 family protein [Tepidisphaeraceae bacterium]
MALPETNREIYHRNPLAEVTVQLRFPPILRIEAEAPAQFQEAIRERYPFYRQAITAGQLPPDLPLPPPIRNLIQGMGTPAGPVQHFFETQDRKCSVTLSRESLALKTMTYARWEEFRDQLEAVRVTFEQVYRPASYTRIGLRYVDVIRRSRLGLDGVRWGELLNPWIGGELSAPELDEGVDSAQRQVHCKLEGDDCFLWLRTGFAQAEPPSSGAPKENCFLLDCDFHTHGSTETTNVTVILNTFNRTAGNLFRWAIRDRLRNALQPQPLE